MPEPIRTPCVTSRTASGEGTLGIDLEDYGREIYRFPGERRGTDDGEHADADVLPDLRAPVPVDTVGVNVNRLLPSGPGSYEDYSSMAFMVGAPVGVVRP